MMGSMYSAVSGLSSHQAKMNVIGNNIANVNTVGFKRGRVTFQEAFNQTLQGASGPQGGRGGSNPKQVGLGVSVGAMDTIHTRGAVERTDIPTDLMINGDGFFIVSNDTSFLNRSYTRAGNFYLDREGNLNAANGYRVLGYRVEEIGEDPKFKTSLEGLVISKNMTFPAKVTGVTSTKKPQDPSKTADAKLEGNIDANTGLDAEVTAKDTDADGTADEWLVPAEKLKAGETTVTVYDELGGAHEIKLTFRRKFKTGFTYDWNAEKFKPGGFADPNAPKIEEAIDPNQWDLVIEPVGAGAVVGGSVPVSFTDGNIDLSRINIEVQADAGDPTVLFANGARAFNFNLDFKDDKGNALVTQFTNDSSLTATRLTGYKQGKLEEFFIGADGAIEATFSNGLSTLIGRVALANFKNPPGLVKTAENMFKDTANSGDPIVGKPGDSGFAALSPGSLEMSNVDLSKEFTDMITTQRGFQANSRIITTSDEMLQELVNLKR